MCRQDICARPRWTWRRCQCCVAGVHVIASGDVSAALMLIIDATICCMHHCCYMLSVGRYCSLLSNQVRSILNVLMPSQVHNNNSNNTSGQPSVPTLSKSQVK